MKRLIRAGGLFLAAAATALAWNEPGHQMINGLAFDSLPPRFPSWIRTPVSQRDRIVFNAGEPDRWRDSPQPSLNQYNRPDHEIDFEDIALAGLDPATLTPFRYDFLLEFMAARAAHPERFPVVDPARDHNHVFALPGFLPWALLEWYGKLAEGFNYEATYAKYGTAEQDANARANIVTMMGVMGHFAGDASQPLHTTTQFNGWNGPNPNGYTTSHAFHEWIDGGYIARAHITAAAMESRLRPARVISTAPRPDGRDPIFVAILGFIEAQNRQVEPLYQLEKDGSLRLHGPPTARGTEFIEGQLLKGAQFLGDLWLTAQAQTHEDAYLRDKLAGPRKKSEKR